MTSENSFRIAVVIVMFLNVSVTAYYRLQASTSGEKISRREEGCLFAAILRLSGLCLFLVTFAYVIDPASVEWGRIQLPVWLRWIGFATGLLCSALMHQTLSSLGKNLTDTVVTRANATLVTHGPYRWVRHPFYVTTALLMGSATLLAANWLIALFSGAVLLLLAVRTPKEERMLTDRFGQDYMEYMKNTGRFLPRMKSTRRRQKL